MQVAGDVSLSEIKVVSIAGIKGAWHIPKEEVRLLEDGNCYVKVNPNSCTLVHMVTIDNPHAPHPLPKRMSLVKCVGLNQLIQQRNCQQLDAVKGSQGAQCTLFADSDPDQHNQKKQKLSARDAKHINADQATMVLSVDTGDDVHNVMKILRPVHPKDCLWVSFDKADIACLVNFLRSEGFDDALSTPKTQGFPKGIQKREKYFMVKYEKHDTTIGWKSFKTLDDAMIFSHDVADGKLAATAECEGADNGPAPDFSSVST